MKHTRRLQAILFVLVATISLSACDSNGGCPEGHDPLYDAQNNVIGCIDQNPGNR